MSRWELVQELFDATVGLDGAERARVLRERAPGDADLARELEGLVAAAGRPFAALEGTAAGLLPALRDEPDPQALCGTSFGPYVVEQHLSSGGMAHVYRARRKSAGTERRVALKVLRPGLASTAFLERFQRERETLARLEHEHIVAFLDAGELHDGRPYLVMEYVEGVPLTQWGVTVGLRRRLELFLQVLDAVQYAHQQLVVHRDLKPSNVLVTAQGVPKLLDFGVASVLEPTGVGAGERGPLTPSYASPEQLGGAAVSTASDVYSLGVLLHELASGSLPRGGSAQIPGDLGAIVQKALAPEAAARYPSAAGLADDLRRFLAGEPIAARPAAWAYRARLFARRQRWPLILLAALIVAPIAGWIGSDLARRRAEKEASHGWGAHAQARAVQSLLADWLVAAAADDAALAGEATARLERDLRERLAALPEAEFLVRMTLARLYLEREDLERAAPHAERAFELSRGTRGVGPADARRATELVAEIRARSSATRD